MDVSRRVGVSSEHREGDAASIARVLGRLRSRRCPARQPHARKRVSRVARLPDRPGAGWLSQPGRLSQGDCPPARTRSVSGQRPTPDAGSPLSHGPEDGRSRRMARRERSVGGGADLLVAKRKLRRDGPCDGAGDGHSDRPARHPGPGPTGKASGRGEAARAKIAEAKPAVVLPAPPVVAETPVPARLRRKSRASPSRSGWGRFQDLGRSDLRASPPRGLAGAAVGDRRAPRGEWPRARGRCHPHGRRRPDGSLRDDPGAGSVLSGGRTHPAAAGRRCRLAGCSGERDQRDRRGRDHEGQVFSGLVTASGGLAFALAARLSVVVEVEALLFLAVGDGRGRLLPGRPSRRRRALRARRSACEVLISSRGLAVSAVLALTLVGAGCSGRTIVAVDPSLRGGRRHRLHAGL